VDGPARASYLFNDGTTGEVAREADGVPGQRRADGVRWGAKFHPEGGAALALITPEVDANHRIAPGAGAGGVGIEGSPPARHFVTWAGAFPAEGGDAAARLRAKLDRLRASLDSSRPPRVTVFAPERRPDR
jgi:hypothetical protein